jgi:hypothetical protein
MLGAILAGGVGLLWLIFAFTDNRPRPATAPSPPPGSPARSPTSA